MLNRLPVVSFKICLLGALFLLFSQAHAATTYYVAATGNDSTGTGTQVLPYATIQKAVTIAAAGDTISVAAGSYSVGSEIQITKALTIVGAQQGVDPRSVTAGPLRSAGGAAETIVNFTAPGKFTLAADNISIDGFDLFGPGGTTHIIESLGSAVFTHAQIQNNFVHHAALGTDSKCIVLTAHTNSIVEKNNVSFCFNSGIEIGANSTGQSTGAIVRNNEVHDLGSAGTSNSAIYVFATPKAAPINVTVQGNLVYNHLGNDGIKVGASNGQDRAVSGGLILDNVVHDVSQDGITIDASDITVQRNEVYNSTSTNGAIYSEQGLANITIENNYVHNNTAALAAILVGFSGITTSPVNFAVRYNSIENNSAPAILFRDKTGGSATLDAKGNWFGASDLATVSTRVVSQPADRIDYTPWLNTSTDADVVTPGFQPNLSDISVANPVGTPLVGAAGRIAKAALIANVGGTVRINSGTYPEDLNINKNITLAIGSNTVTLSAADGVYLACTTSLNGGTLTSANGLNISGILTGAGAVVGAIQVLNGGAITPGGASTGILNTGAVSLSSPSTFAVDLNGTTPSAGFDQINSNSPINLGSATLTGSVGFSPAANTSYTIIQSTQPITGVFAQGATVNFGAYTFNIVVDNSAATKTVTLTLPTLPPNPLVSVNQAAAQQDPTNATSIVFTAVFNAPVTGFGSTGVSLSGTAGATSAIVAEITPNDGTTYSITINGMTLSGGTVLVSIPAGAGFSATNVPNLASTSSDNSVTWDNVAPTATFTSGPTVLPASAATNTTTVIVTYGDASVGPDSATFAADNITVNNGATVSAFSAAGNAVTYSVTAPAATWSASVQGYYTVSLVAGKVKDRAGNAIAGIPTFGNFLVATTPTSVGAWSLQSDYFGTQDGISQPRSLRGLALSADGSFLYGGFINGTATSRIRKIISGIQAQIIGNEPVQYNGTGSANPKYDTNLLAGFTVTGGGPKGLATDDRGNVFAAVATTPQFLVFNSNLVLTKTVNTTFDFNGCAVQKLNGTYYLYLMSSRGTIQRWNVSNPALAHPRRRVGCGWKHQHQDAVRIRRRLCQRRRG